MNRARLFLLIAVAAGFSLSFRGGGGCPGGIRTSEPEETVPEATPDTTPPAVSSVSPDGSARVTRSTAIEVTFSEAMDRASVESAFSLDGVLGLFSWNDDNTVLTFIPSSELDPNTEYCARVSTDATDAAGNPLDEGIEACFTTKCLASAEFVDSRDHECFTLYKVTATVGGFTEETLPSTFLESAAVADGRLTLDHKTTLSAVTDFGAPGINTLAKQLTPGDFSVELLVSGGIPANPNESVGLALSGTNDISDLAVIHVHFPTVQEGLTVEAVAGVNGEFDADPSAAAVNSATVFLSLARSGSTLTYSYKTSEEADYTVLRTQERTAAGDILGGDSEPLLVMITIWTENELGLFSPIIDRFRFLVGGAEGQE